MLTPRPRSAWLANSLRGCVFVGLLAHQLFQTSLRLTFACCRRQPGSLGVVLLLVLPHPQHGCGDHARQAELRESRLRAAVEKPFVASMNGIFVALSHHRRRGALEDALQEVIVLTREAARLWNSGLDPGSVGRLHPVGA